MGPAKLITLRKSLRKCTFAEPKNRSAGVIHGLIVPVHQANLSSISYSRNVQSGCFHCGSVGSQGFCWHSGEESPPLAHSLGGESVQSFSQGLALKLIHYLFTKLSLMILLPVAQITVHQLNGGNCCEPVKNEVVLTEI